MSYNSKLKEIIQKDKMQNITSWKQGLKSNERRQRSAGMKGLGLGCLTTSKAKLETNTFKVVVWC